MQREGWYSIRFNNDTIEDRHAYGMEIKDGLVVFDTGNSWEEIAYPAENVKSIRIPRAPASSPQPEPLQYQDQPPESGA